MRLVKVAASVLLADLMLYVTGLPSAVALAPVDWRPFVVLVTGLFGVALAAVWLTVRAEEGRGCEVVRHHHLSYCHTHRIQWTGGGPCPRA